MTKHNIFLQWRDVGTLLFRRYTHVHLTLLDQSIVSGVNFTTGILLARILGIKGYGEFMLLWMAILFLTSFQTALIISPMMSIGGKQNSGDEPSYYGALILQQLVFAVATSGLLLLLVPLTTFINADWHINNLALPLASVSLTYQLQEFLRRYFFTRMRPLDALINDTISYVGQLFALLTLSYLNYLNIETALWIIATTSAFAVGAGFLRIGTLSWKTDRQWSIFIRHLHFSKWLIASTMMTWLSGNFILITAGAVLGAAAVGTLKACQNIIAITHILFNALGNIIPVRAAALLHQKGSIAFEHFLTKSIIFGGVATLILTLPAILIPEQSLKWLYGVQMTGKGWVLSSYALIYMVVFCSQMLTFGLQTMEDTKPIFKGYLFAGSISLLLAYPLCKLYGLIGVMAGLLLLVLINCLVLFKGFQARRKACLEAGFSRNDVTEFVSKENAA